MGCNMEKQKARTDDIYLTRKQVEDVLEALNLLMRNHYSDYDQGLPEEIIDIVNIFTESRNKFKYCYTCRDFYYMRWSNSECRDCPEEEE